MGGGGFEGPSKEQDKQLLFFEYDVTKEKNLDPSKGYLASAEIVDDATSNPASIGGDNSGSSNSGIGLGANNVEMLDTLTYSPNFKNENPYPRKFWPDVNPQAAVYAAMVSSIWLAVLTLWLYIRFSGRSYDALFNEEDSDSHHFERKAEANSSRADKKVLKQVSIVGIKEHEQE